jgi:hypothetical protein
LRIEAIAAMLTALASGEPFDPSASGSISA